MNKYMFLFLAGYIFIQVIEYGLQLLNIRHMKKYGADIPFGFEGYVDALLLQKTRAYTLEHNSLSLVESVFGNVVLIFFIFGGVLTIYDSWISSLNLSFVLKGTLFFLILSWASSFLAIPFGLFSTFKIENKYGFNAMTPKLWLSDFMKSLLISTVLLSAVLLVSFSIIKWSPHFWWLFVWGFFFIFSIFMMYIAPYVIEPLFNKFTPLAGDSLEERIRTLMGKVGITVSRVFTMDASKRSRHTNAYFTGIGKVKRIVLYDTLVNLMDADEVLAVLAHETGHWKKKHILKRIVVFELISFIGVFLAYRILRTDALAEMFMVPDATLFSQIVILGFIFSILSFPFGPLSNYFSRRHEKEADRFATDLTSNPESLATSLIKLSKDNLSNLHPHPLYAAVHYSHPPVVERVRKLKEKDRQI